MSRTSLRPYYMLGMLIALLLAVTAGAGLLIEGIYRPFLSETIVAFQFFQDFVSLLVAPLLLAAMFLAGRGSLRAFIVWAGLLVYVAYYYAFYAFGFVYTAFYPLYLALVGLASASLIGLLAGVDREAFQAHVDERMPVRFIGGVLGTAALFVPIWLGMLGQRIAAQRPEETDLVFVLDLCFLIPATVFAAVQVWRRRPVGYLLSGVLLVKATMSGLLLTGGELLKMQLGLPPALDQLAMYVFLGVAGSLGLAGYLRNLHDRPAQPAHRQALPDGRPAARVGRRRASGRREYRL
jgi:hypothetical protein